MTNSRRIIEYFGLLTCAGTVLVTVITAAFGEWSAGAFVFVCFIACWLSLPYLVSWLALHWLWQSRVAQAVGSAGMLVAALVGISAFGWMMLVKPDAQSALMILFLPIWQMAVVVPCVAFGSLASLVGPWTD